MITFSSIGISKIRQQQLSNKLLAEKGLPEREIVGQRKSLSKATRQAHRLAWAGIRGNRSDAVRSSRIDTDAGKAGRCVRSIEIGGFYVENEECSSGAIRSGSIVCV